MHVSEIMTKEVITVTPETPIHEVASLIFDKNLTGMPVIDQFWHVVGIITEYDLMSRSEHIHLPTYLNLLKQLTKGSNTKEISSSIQKIQSLAAKDLMTREVVTVAPETPIEDAAQIFADQHINPLPVVKDGMLIGIVSRADIVKLFKKGNKAYNK